MGRLSYLGLIVLSAAWAVASAAEARAHAWVMRGATAVFASEFDGHAIFEGRCDYARGELVLSYFHEPLEVAPTARDRLAFRRGAAARAVKLRTQLIDGRLVGRVRITRVLMQRLSSGGELELDAPNAMEEPWYAGEAGPLMSVMRECFVSRRGER